MITQTIKQIRNLAILVSLMIFCISCDDSTGVDRKKEDLKTEIFGKWFITTECIESNGGVPLGTKQNETWIINTVSDKTDEVYFTVGRYRTKAVWNTNDLYNFPHWVMEVSGYDDKNGITVGFIYDIVELTPMKGKISVYIYVKEIRNWILINRYSFMGNRQ